MTPSPSARPSQTIRWLLPRVRLPQARLAQARLAQARLPRALVALLVLLFIDLAAGGAALAQQDVRTRVDAIRAEIAQLSRAAEMPGANDAQLLEIRGKVEPLLEELRGVVSEQTPRLEGVKARLEQLGPKPDASKGETEAPEVARERDEQEKLQREIEGLISFARAQIVAAEQTVAKIQDLRRAILTRALMERSQSVLSPTLWIAVLNAVPGEVRAFNLLMQGWISAASARINTVTLAILGVALALALALMIPGRRLAHRFEGRPADVADPPRLARALAALRVTLMWAVIPTIVCAGLFNLIDMLGLLPDRVDPVVRALVFGLAFIAFAHGLADGVLCPDDPNWRLIAMEDAAARRMARLATTFATILVAGKVLEALYQAIYAVLSVTVASKGVVAVVAALALVRALQTGARRDADPEEADGQAVAAGGSMPIRLFGWLAALAILGAALLGYVALATFLMDQVTWVVTIGALFLVSGVLIDELVGKGLSADGRFGRQMMAQTGLKRRSVQQISILSNGALRLILIVIAALFLLAPWGLDGGDFLGTLRAALFGFSVGGVSISISTIVIAIALFMIGFTATRAVQRWLDKSYLPHTGLDPGLRNSISTILGYIGIFAAAMVALSSLGLSLDRITIVAGALSVGIGFGLQSIVNNFVSGLILLWERPIRVGDQIVVGGESGTVKRINVRSTQIETFDRAALIVPNSEFISGKVKNWTHSDRLARIIIPLGVGYGSDPEQVRAILLTAAEAHKDVFRDPPPRVFFMQLGDPSMEFELRCFCDVDATLRVKSELLFTIFKELRKARIDFPMPKRPTELLEAAIEYIAEERAEDMALARSAEGSLPPSAPPPSAPPPAAPAAAAKPARKKAAAE